MEIQSGGPMAAKLQEYKDQNFGLSPAEQRQSKALNGDWDENAVRKDTDMENTDQASNEAQKRKEILDRQSATSMNSTAVTSEDRQALLDRIKQRNSGEAVETPPVTSAAAIGDGQTETEAIPKATHIRQEEPGKRITVEEMASAGRDATAVEAMENCHKCKYLHPTTDHPDKAYFPCYKEANCPAKVMVFMQQPVPEDVLDEIISIIRETGELEPMEGVANELFEQFDRDPSNFAFRAGLKQLAIAFCMALDIRVPNE